METNREPLGTPGNRFWAMIAAVTPDQLWRWTRIGSTLAGIGLVLVLLLEFRVLRNVKLYPIAGGMLYAGVGLLSWAGGVALWKRHWVRGAIDSPGGGSPPLPVRRLGLAVLVAFLFLLGIAGAGTGVFALFILTADSLGF